MEVAVFWGGWVGMELVRLARYGPAGVGGGDSAAERAGRRTGQDRKWEQTGNMTEILEELLDALGCTPV